MSDIFTMISGKDDVANRVCQVAYTLNNDQPVQCTFIGSQPLFYMDYELDYEDETAMLDMADFDFLENELHELKKEIETLDRFSSDFEVEPEKTFENFLSDSAFITGTEKTEPMNSIEYILEKLSQSRLAKTYIEFSKEHSVEIRHSAQITDAEYDRETGLIHINPNLEFDDQLLVCARELRRHWQHRQGGLINPLTFQPDTAILINRVQSADLAINMVRIAWELQLADIKSVWERIENSSLSDLGHAIAREAFLDFRSLNNGEASAAMFETWFLSERCQKEDRALIQKMLSNYGGFAFDFDAKEQGITPTLIAALGSMPFGKNYLAQHALTIMEDPIFTDVRDRSNANFLWFIKCERSFKETEQELQLDGEQLTDGKSFPHAQHTHQGVNYDQQSTGDIVNLFSTEESLGSSIEETATAGDKSQESGGRLKPKPAAGRTNKKGSADIIYLRRWSGD